MRSHLVTTCTGILLATPCLAISQDKQNQTVPFVPDLVSVFETVGAPVVFADTIPKRVTDKKELQPVKVGTVDDFVIEARTCLTKFVAVATDGKCRAVPAERVAWAGKFWALKMRAKEFHELPYLPHKDLDDTWDGKHCYATRLAHAAIVSRDDKTWGKAVDVVLERRMRVVAFMKVEARGGPVAIPAGAIAIAVKGDVTDQPKILVDQTAAQLDKAPRIGAKKTKQLTRRAFREQLYEYFEVSRPIWELPHRRSEVGRK